VRQYPEIASSLHHLYLEDSYVLGIRIGGHSLEFELEAVLCEAHELYHPPDANTQYCYRTGILHFPGLIALKWKEIRFLRSIDADGQIDFGNIDSFWEEDDGSYYLVGDWGEVDVKSGVPFFTPNP